MSHLLVPDIVTDKPRMTRDLPPGLARIVAWLELEEATLVTIHELKEFQARAGIKTDAKVLAQRLRDKGWLLPTEQRGVWEFAPGSHAGAIGRGHPFTDVQAVLAAHPKLQAAICLLSALWVHNLVPRAPERPEVALPQGIDVPAALKRAARVTRFNHGIATRQLRGTAVHAPSTILVHLAARPTDVRSWGAVMEALPELMLQVTIDDLLIELADRPASVSTRLAYLIHGIDPDLADSLAPPGSGKVWFGPRGPLKRHDSRYDIADTVLPYSPAEIRRHADCAG